MTNDLFDRDQQATAEAQAEMEACLREEIARGVPIITVTDKNRRFAAILPDDAPFPGVFVCVECGQMTSGHDAGAGLVCGGSLVDFPGSRRHLCAGELRQATMADLLGRRKKEGG